jgi:hypothetical protein
MKKNFNRVPIAIRMWGSYPYGGFFSVTLRFGKSEPAIGDCKRLEAGTGVVINPENKPVGFFNHRRHYQSISCTSLVPVNNQVCHLIT